MASTESGHLAEAVRIDFDAFFTTKPQGTGTGPALNRSIIESHGGRFRAVPNDGRGTTFDLALRVETLAPVEGADVALV